MSKTREWLILIFIAIVVVMNIALSIRVMFTEPDAGFWVGLSFVTLVADMMVVSAFGLALANKIFEKE